MNPIAIACQSGHGGSGAPSSCRRRSRQRTSRMGKVSDGEDHASEERPGVGVPDLAHDLVEVDAAQRPAGAARPRGPVRRDRRGSGAPSEPARPPRQDSSSASGTRSSSSCRSGRIAARSEPPASAAAISPRNGGRALSAERPR